MLDLVGASKVAYDDEDDCGFIDNELDEFVDVFTGGTITGDLCWPVRTSDVSSLVLYDCCLSERRAGGTLGSAKTCALVGSENESSPKVSRHERRLDDETALRDTRS